MSYLVSQMWLCLLLAGALGFLLGWLLKQLGFGSKLTELEASWKSRFVGVEGERDKLRSSVSDLTGQAKKVETDWTSKYSTLTADRDKLQLSLSAWEKKNIALEADWKGKWNSLDVERKKLSADLETCGAKSVAAENDLSTWKLKISDLEKATASAREDQSSLSSKLAAGAAALAVAEATRVTLGNDSRKLAAQLQEVQAKLGTTEAEWKSRFLHLENQNITLKSDFESKRKQDHDLKAKHAAAEADWKSRWLLLEKERDDLKTSLESKPKQDQEEHAKHAAAEANWKSRWIVLEKERDDFRSRFDASTASIGASTLRITALESEIEKLKKSAVIPGDIEYIEGIGRSYGDKLRGVGIAWIKTYLDRCASKLGRVEVAQQTGINETLLLTWVNMADLLRLWGVTPDWAELLEASGVDTVKEIKHRIPENLHPKMSEVNAEKNLARSVPTLEMVTSWVEQAKALQPLITH